MNLNTTTDGLTGMLGANRLALEDHPEVQTAVKEAAALQNPGLVLMEEADELALLDHLRSRMVIGQNQRNARMQRMLRIDRSISTWQRHSGEDAKRLSHEDRTGEQTAVASNLPIMAAHLEDLTAFFTETLSPVANPFVSNSQDEQINAIVKRLTKDVAPRGYYSKITRAVRGAVKYNLGGVIVEWDAGSAGGTATNGVQTPGNDYSNADAYNTFWDPAIKDPTEIHQRAEWAGYVRPVSRIELLRRVTKGYWVAPSDVFDSQKSETNHDKVSPLKLWFDPSRAIPTSDGADAVGEVGPMSASDWADIGLSMPSDSSFETDMDAKELTVMYCWLVPAQFGLLSENEIGGIEEAGHTADTFLELWRFDILDGNHIANARPHSPRERFLAGEPAVIPIFMTYLLQDDMLAAQRSPMELIVPFQRLASSMYSIGVKALRRSTWGVTVFDRSMIEQGDAETASTSDIASIGMKKSGDVRQAIQNFTSTSGAAEAFAYTNTALGLKNQLFPGQALPAQVAGLDRAVSNQVSALVHGAQRGLRMSLRLFDEGVFTPARMEAVRNLQRFEPLISQDVSDESLAKEFGSGVDALESERIVDAVEKLLMAIVQNQEAMQYFDVPAILRFLGRTMRINVDLGTFAKQGPAAPQAAPTEGEASPEDQALAAAAAGMAAEGGAM